MYICIQASIYTRLAAASAWHYEWDADASKQCQHRIAVMPAAAEGKGCLTVEMRVCGSALRAKRDCLRYAQPRFSETHCRSATEEKRKGTCLLALTSLLEPVPVQWTATSGPPLSDKSSKYFGWTVAEGLRYQ